MRPILPPLRHQAVRDLAWVMAAPGLVDEAAVPDFAVPDTLSRSILTQAMPKLLELDQAPAPLHAWIAARNSQRLGRYFETLLEYWLRHLVAGQLLAANLPVKDGNTVTGEYDFLWRDGEGDLHHWEASVKFYLQTDPAAGLAGYVGTLIRDRFDRKFSHLRDKQLKLARTAAGAASLPNPGEPVIARALLKGWLFYPHGQPPAPAPEISPHHLRGWWRRWGETSFEPQPGLRWKILPRLEWLSLATNPAGEGLQGEGEFADALKDHFTQGGGPLLVAGLAKRGEGWEEMSRGFVVPARWNRGGT